jgi:biotin transporter BioY
MGEASGHRRLRQPFRRLVRTRDRAAALHSSTADAAKLWRARGWVAAWFAPRFRRTGGFLLAYPLAAFVAGWIFERYSKHSSHRFSWAALSALAAEVVLFTGGLSWLAVLTHSVSLAIRFGLYWFIFAEVIKVLLAASVATRWQQRLASWV